MIAKRVMRSKGGSFKRLGEYIAAQEFAKWQRTAEYILDALGTGIRVANIRISNSSQRPVPRFWRSPSRRSTMPKSGSWMQHPIRKGRLSTMRRRRRKRTPRYQTVEASIVERF